MTALRPVPWSNGDLILTVLFKVGIPVSHHMLKKNILYIEFVKF